MILLHAAACRSLAFLATSALLAQPALAQSSCPLVPVADSNLVKVFRGHLAATDRQALAFAFRSKADRDYDGAPNAYHRGLETGLGEDAGLDHICNGGTVLALVDGKLVRKYHEGENPGTLAGHSGDCKADYIRVREEKFPLCSAEHPLCMSWFGVQTEAFRSCGLNLEDADCGIPFRQRDAGGRPGDFYLSKNILINPDHDDSSTDQSDYADATKIPFIVMPGGSVLPVPKGWGAGDYGVVVANGRAAFGVVGDSGPATKLGEVSSAMLDDLRLSRPATIETANGAFTLVLPGSSDYRGRGWPLEPAALRAEAKRRVLALLGGSEAEAMRTLFACADPS